MAKPRFAARRPQPAKLGARPARPCARPMAPFRDYPFLKILITIVPLSTRSISKRRRTATWRYTRATSFVDIFNVVAKKQVHAWGPPNVRHVPCWSPSEDSKPVGSP
jgi:hypothetical protein